MLAAGVRVCRWSFGVLKLTPPGVGSMYCLPPRGILLKCAMVLQDALSYVVLAGWDGLLCCAISVLLPLWV